MSVSRLQEGDRLARPVHSGQGSILAPAGLQVQGRLQQRLKEFGISRVYVEDPATAGIEPQEPIAEPLLRRLLHHLSGLEQSLQAGRLPHPFPLAEGRNLVEGIVAEWQERIPARLIVPLMPVSGESLSAIHAINVALFTVGLATFLGLGTYVGELGLAALYHDLGTRCVPDLFPASLAAGETDHSLLGYHLLGQAGAGPLCRTAVLNHHERLDGQGRPRGLQGEDFPQPTQVLAIAEEIVSLLDGQGEWPRQSPGDALEALMTESGTGFSPYLVERISQLVVPYPVGELVQLSTGHTAVVTEIQSVRTGRPKVRLVAGEEPGPVWDLLDPARMEITIVDVVEEVRS